jgi:hypothetical protein
MFTVSNGVITAASFQGYSVNNIDGSNDNNSFQFNKTYSYAKLGPFGYDSVIDSSGATFALRVSVPEPGTVILLSLEIAGLSFSRYKKKAG